MYDTCYYFMIMPYKLPDYQSRFEQIGRKAAEAGDLRAIEYKHRAAVSAAQTILTSPNFTKQNTTKKTRSKKGNKITRSYSHASKIFNLDVDSLDMHYGARVVYRSETSYEKRALLPGFLGKIAAKCGTVESTQTYAVERYHAGFLDGVGYTPIDSPSVIPAALGQLSTRPESLAALDSFLGDTEFIAQNHNIRLIDPNLTAY